MKRENENEKLENSPFRPEMCKVKQTPNKTRIKTLHLETLKAKPDPSNRLGEKKKRKEPGPQKPKKVPANWTSNTQQ